MKTEELLEKDSHFTQARVRLNVLLEQVTARHSQVRLGNGCWRAKCVFWSVKASKPILIVEIRG